MTVTSIAMTKGPGLTGDADHSLVERAFAGDPEAFAHVVTAQRTYVARLAQRLLGWDPEVEDVVQDVFTAAWQRRAQLREPDRVRPWLASITVNAARARLRRRKVRRALLLDAAHRGSDTSAETPTAGAAMEREELGRQVRDAVNALPQRDKEVLVLRYLEHMAVDEVARALKLRANTVEVRLHRARKRLAERLPEDLQT